MTYGMIDVTINEHSCWTHTHTHRHRLTWILVVRVAFHSINFKHSEDEKYGPFSFIWTLFLSRFGIGIVEYVDRVTFISGTDWFVWFGLADKSKHGWDEPPLPMPSPFFFGERTSVQMNVTGVYDTWKCGKSNCSSVLW